MEHTVVRKYFTMTLTFSITNINYSLVINKTKQSVLFCLKKQRKNLPTNALCEKKVNTKEARVVSPNFGHPSLTSSFKKI